MEWILVRVILTIVQIGQKGETSHEKKSIIGWPASLQLGLSQSDWLQGTVSHPKRVFRLLIGQYFEFWIVLSLLTSLETEKKLSLGERQTNLFCTGLLFLYRYRFIIKIQYKRIIYVSPFFKFLIHWFRSKTLGLQKMRVHMKPPSFWI